MRDDSKLQEKIDCWMELKIAWQILFGLIKKKKFFVSNEFLDFVLKL